MGNKPVIKASVYSKKGKLLATAVNSFTKTHPLQLKYALQCNKPHQAYLHAEIAYLIKSKGKGYKIIVERYNRAGKPMLAKPCDICMKAINQSKIKRIEYTI